MDEVALSSDLHRLEDDHGSKSSRKPKPVAKAKSSENRKSVVKAKGAKRLAKQAKLVAELPGKVAHDALPSGDAAEQPLQKPAARQTENSPTRKSTSKTAAKPAPTAAPAADTTAAATAASATSPSGDLGLKTRQELLLLARSRDVTGRNAMPTAELVAALS